MPKMERSKKHMLTHKHTHKNTHTHTHTHTQIHMHVTHERVLSPVETASHISLLRPKEMPLLLKMMITTGSWYLRHVH